MLNKMTLALSLFARHSAVASKRAYLVTWMSWATGFPPVFKVVVAKLMAGFESNLAWFDTETATA